MELKPGAVSQDLPQVFVILRTAAALALEEDNFAITDEESLVVGDVDESVDGEAMGVIGIAGVIVIVAVEEVLDNEVVVEVVEADDVLVVTLCMSESGWS